MSFSLSPMRRALPVHFEVNIPAERVRIASLGLVQNPPRVFSRPKIGVVQQGRIPRDSLNASSGIFAVSGAGAFRLREAAALFPAARTLGVFQQITGERLNAAALELQTVGIAPPEPLSLACPQAFYFVTIEAARQNNVVMIANPLDARGGVGVLVFGDNYVFQRRPARLFVGGGKATNEIVTISAGLCLGRRLLAGAVGERNVQIALVKIRNDQLHKMAAGVSVVEVCLCLSRWQAPGRGWPLLS